MSAWIVPKEHIDICVTAIMRTPQNAAKFTDEDKDSIGQVLWEECWNSIADRYSHYPDGERPGPIGFTYDEIAGYRYREPQFEITAGEALGALGCYSYQSCEHNGWEDSLAYSIVTAAIAYHETGPGEPHYEGPWGWGAEDIAERERGEPAITT